MPTEQQGETRREIAAAFAEKWNVYANPVDAVEELLKSRDERAARIAERFRGGFTVNVIDGTLQADPDGPWCLGVDVAAAIRNEE